MICGVLSISFDRGDTFAGAGPDQALRENRPQVVPHVHEDLCVLLLGKHIDDAVECFGSIVGVQRTKDEVTGTGHIDRRLHRFAIANLTDLQHVRRRTHRALQRTTIRFRVQSHFALVDDRLLVGMQEFDRILDSNDVR